MTVGPAAAVTLGGVARWFGDGAHWRGSDGIPHRLAEHVALCGLSLLVAAAVAVPVGVWLGHLRRGGVVAQNVANIGRAIPSFAILVVAVPLVGIGSRPAQIALVALAIPPLLTNTYVGMITVDDDVRDAAQGMGMTGLQTVLRAELPLAGPLILAGLRTATFQVIATATLAAEVAWGGLGRFIVDGLAVRDDTEVVCGSLLVIALALAAEAGFALVRRLLVPAALRRTEGSPRPQPLEESTHAIRLDPAA